MRPSPGGRCALLFGLLFVLVGGTHAGMRSPCDDPTVLSGARVQVFIFPYEAERALTPQGRALATVVQRHILSAALKYQSIGVAELTESEGPCKFDIVAERVRVRLRPGQTAIFVHGRIFEQGSNVYLKSAVSVSTVPGPATLQWPLAPQAQATITTTTPSEVRGFAPRTIPLQFLEQLQPAERLTGRVHTEPNDNAPFTELPAGPSDRYTFLVLGARNDWMQIRVLPDGVEGWVPAHALATGQELKGAFPELYFIDGLVGYYSLGQDAATGQRLLEITLGSLARYLQETESLPESDPRALASLLMGNARLRAAGAEWPTPTLQSARDDYRRAALASPTWTPAQSHLLASTALLCVRGACGDQAPALRTQYLEAISRDPTSRELLNGLSAYYDAVSLGRLASGLSPEALASQREALRDVQSSMLQQ